MKTGLRFYIDTSLYLGWLIGDKQAKKAIRQLGSPLLCSSVLLVLETERNLVRLSRQGQLSVSQYTQAADKLKSDRDFFLLKELTMDLCLTGLFPPIRIPRSSDLIHLRTAKWFQDNGGLAGFVTLDQRQSLAAAEIGLPVGMRR